jgi:hypothetical protein
MFHFARIMFFVIVWLALNAAILPAWPWIARRMNGKADDGPREPAQRLWHDRRTGEWR